MIRATFTLAIFLLSVDSLSYAADPTQRKLFCTFHSKECEVEKIAKPGMKSVCWFHKDHAERLEITPVRYPAITAWHNPDISFDSIIAGGQKIPYCYAQIKKEPNLNAYVLRCEYEPLRDAALIYLGEKEKQLSSRLEDEPIRGRIKEYVTILNSDKAPKLVDAHECVGLIVSIRAVKVALQWAHFMDDHTEDDELVALYSELDKLVPKATADALENSIQTE